MKNILISIFCLFVVRAMAQNDPTQVCNTAKISIIIKEQILNPPPIVLLGGADFDNDGLPDHLEIVGDCDGDGIANWQDPDSDNDIILDGDDTCPCHYALNTVNGCPATLTERNVFWLHGYGGNELSWLQVAEDDIMERFQADCIRTDYGATTSILALCAGNVEGRIDDEIDSDINLGQNFLIAHSMGGLVAREIGAPLQASGMRKFNGLITFGTPHQGAAAANTLINTPNRIPNLIVEACTKLGHGPALEGITSITPNSLQPLLAALNLFGVPEIAVGAACNGILGPIVPGLLDAVSIGVEPELTTNSVPANVPPMATTHNAAFYGIENDEDDTLFPRFLGSILPKVAPPPNSPSGTVGPNGEFIHPETGKLAYPLYSMGDNIDQRGMDEFAKFHDFYAQKRIQWHNTTTINISTGNIVSIIANPIGGIASTLGLNLLENYNNSQIGSAYADGETFLNNFNHTWKGIIGALEIEVVYTGDCQCTEYQQGAQIGEQFIITNNGEPSECAAFGNSDGMGTGTECSPYYVGSEITKPSDGFILAESAMNAPGMTYFPTRLMPGSNHIQMRNDPNTEEAMHQIFDLGLEQSYFITPPR